MDNIFHDIEEILKKHFPDEQWNIMKTSEGMSEQAYIADNGQRKLFIKFDVKTPTLKRLSELGVAPLVIYDGTNEERPYIIQEFVVGTYPEKDWFPNNVALLAKFIKTYQQDELLKKIVSKGPKQSYQEHIEREISIIEKDIQQSSSDILRTEEVIEGVKLLKEKSKKLSPVPLVPTHADPNIKNFLITDNGLLMVDWDDIKLSDPMKDVGLMLWWYVAKSKWPEFFAYYRQELDEGKIYWWTARASLSIAIWFAKRDDKENAKFFLEDFLFALQKKDNSQTFNNLR